MKIRRLIDQAISILGSQTALASATGYTQNGIWQARERERVTAELAKQIHHATQGKVPGSSLRPDIWMHPDHVPPC